MTYDSYIISYAPGSAGTFLASILGLLLRGSSDVLTLSERNNAAGNEGYLGVSLSDPHSADIYQRLFFDEHSDIRVLKTHVYPNFSLINSKFSSIGIILVTLSEDDMLTVIGNNGYKNNDIKDYMNGKEIISRISTHWKRFTNFAPFVNPITPELSNILKVKYSDIFLKNEHGFVAQQQIEEFTGLKFTEQQIHNWKKYADNQTAFLEKYMPWLNEVKTRN